jgi:hypothetical protein
MGRYVCSLSIMKRTSYYVSYAEISNRQRQNEIPLRLSELDGYDRAIPCLGTFVIPGPYMRATISTCCLLLYSTLGKYNASSWLHNGSKYIYAR